MAVEERLMAWGSWDLTLSEDTPQTLLDTLDFFGHVFVFPAEVSPREMSDADLKAAAWWAGVVLQISVEQRTLGGHGMPWWLGDQDRHGHIVGVVDGMDNNDGYTNRSFLSFIHEVTDGKNSGSSALTEGTYTQIATPAQLDTTFRWVSAKKVVDFCCGFWEGEYRVNPDATFDVGTTSDLFAVDPRVVVGPGLSGHTSDLVGVDLSSAGPGFPSWRTKGEDASEYTTRVSVIGRDSNDNPVLRGGDNFTSVYTGPQGNPVDRERSVDNPHLASTDAGSVASAELRRYRDLRQPVTVDTDRSGIRDVVAPGDWTWMYHPEQGFVDTANQIQFAGATLHPLKMRCQAVTWPVESGLGVCYRSHDGNWHDLTPHVEFEERGGQLEVGTGRRPLALDNVDFEFPHK